jgi:hypothetical protein
MKDYSRLFKIISPCIIPFTTILIDMEKKTEQIIKT